ncbi:flagellar filament capping protein FliD [Desulfovibrio sp. JC022]|uniref:flagellar filament capping protein FliD n=1 Tax=Desulfovibrio sp. JC022 TaxID=2593642 RepID=UPI0013D8112D|nr:flagellar filament capping protein FliD [Desulfovibrio sp. JC022]NDV23264.1 flagellar hook-associated protein [Desulfovibrio sp. JC022]
MADIGKVGAQVSTAGTTSSYWSGKTKFEKLGNGTDFGKIVETTIKQQGFHQRRLKNWRSQWVQKKESLKDLNTKMGELSTALKKMDSIGKFMGRVTTSTDSASVTATADSTAPTSPYKVEIKQLARNDIWTSSSSFASDKAVVSPTASKISISCAGKTANLDVPAGTTVEGLVKMLNATTELKGNVQVEAIKTGNEYRLKFSSLKMGEANRITFNSSTTLAALAPSAMSNLQQGQNSKLKIDGFPEGADNWIERDTNMVTDGSKGLTLNLKKPTSPGTVIVNVSTDTEKIMENVREFVKQVNVVRKALRDISKVDTTKDKNKGSILTGNYGVQLASHRFKDLTATKGQGFNNFDSEAGSGDRYNTLSTLGIETDTDQSSPNFGLLKIDEEKFEKAMKDDPDGVAKLFSADYEASTSSPNFTIKSLIKGVTKPGSHEVSYTVSGGKITSATINGKAARIAGWEITADDMAGLGMALRVDNHADGTYSGTAGIKTGKTIEMIETLKDMTNSKTGILNIISENYTGIIKNIDKKLDYEKNRLERLEKTLKAKYSRLDTVLSKYGGKLKMLQGQIAKLGSGKK